MMKYNEFEEVFSSERVRRYVNACDGKTRLGMTLYRYNLVLSGELLKIISCFEVALRNRINNTLELYYGSDWLRDSCLPGGIFDTPRTYGTQKIIGKAYKSLIDKDAYTPTRLMTEMEFGVWKYMYSGPQYAATGQKLLSVFPAKPKSTQSIRIDNKYIFNELDSINKIRNRIAHNEPICFITGMSKKSISFALTEYLRIMKLFTWMGIDGQRLLYGIDHVNTACRKILGL